MWIVIGSDDRPAVTKHVVPHLRDQDRELSLIPRLTRQALADEILDPWFGTLPGDDPDDVACTGRRNALSTPS